MPLRKIKRLILFCDDCRTYIRVEYWEKYPDRCPFCNGLAGSTDNKIERKIKEKWKKRKWKVS